MIGSENFAKLEKYANLDGSEVGEYVGRLLDLRNYSQPHGMTDEFNAALDAELLHWLERFETETTIETVTVPQPDKTYDELIWIDA